MAARPRILIPARFSESASALRYRAEVTSRALVEGVWAAGGEPVMIHPVAGSDDEVAERLSIADGVLLPGGGDLAAHWTGQEPHPTLYDVDETQDAFDLAVARIALAQGTPLLAICRGLQVVNAALGGTVVQDMDSAYGENRHHRHHVHTIAVAADSVLAGVVGEKAEVSCYHHQCLATLGERLRVIARADDDVIEAVELDGATGWFLGVQWHPEDTWSTNPAQLGVFEALVDASR